MADVLQFRRGTQAENDAFTGAAGELSVDTTNWKLRVHDNSTAGGFTLARDSHTHAASDITEISNLTAAEGAQLENIGSVTISNTQWGRLGSLDQGVATTDSPTFAGLTFNARTPEHATDGGTDAFASATNTSTPGDGNSITRDFQSANTTTTPSLDGKTLTTRDGSALWAGAVSGVHDVQYDSGADTYLVLEPLPIDEDDMASDSDEAVPTQQSVKAYADGLVADVLDAITDADTLTWHEGNLQSISTASYATIFDLASATELLGGAISGPTAGARLTVDGTVVFNRTSGANGEDSGGTDAISTFAIPPAKAGSSMKLEVYNYSGSTQTFGWRAVTR